MLTIASMQREVWTAGGFSGSTPHCGEAVDLPYVPRQRRQELLGGAVAETPGDLSFLFSSIADDYLQRKRLSYATINDIVGALEGAKLEFYARVARPYEDGKIEAHGDVYLDDPPPHPSRD